MLWQEDHAWPLHRMSDEEVIDRTAELLVSGRFHVHSQPWQAVSRQCFVKGEKLVAFPISERKPGPQAAPSSGPASDPPTFPPDIDGDAQAEALVAAASSGKPFCPE